MFIFILILIILNNLVNGLECEKRDGECPSCENKSGNLSSGTFTYLSYNPIFDLEIIKIQNELYDENIINFNNFLELHMSFNYLCCHNEIELKIISNIIENLGWQPFKIKINDIGCNYDIHNNKNIYLHLLSYDTQIMNLTNTIENKIKEQNITIYNSRQKYGPLFHITIATTNEYFNLTKLNKFKNKYFGEFEINHIILSNPLTINFKKIDFRI